MPAAMPRNKALIERMLERVRVLCWMFSGTRGWRRKWDSARGGGMVAIEAVE